MLIKSTEVFGLSDTCLEKVSKSWRLPSSHQLLTDPAYQPKPQLEDLDAEAAHDQHVTERVICHEKKFTLVMCEKWAWIFQGRLHKAKWTFNYYETSIPCLFFSTQNVNMDLLCTSRSHCLTSVVWGIALQLWTRPLPAHCAMSLLSFHSVLLVAETEVTKGPVLPMFTQRSRTGMFLGRWTLFSVDIESAKKLLSFVPMARAFCNAVGFSI